MELLQRSLVDRLDPTQQDLLDRAERAAQRLRSMVADLVAYAFERPKASERVDASRVAGAVAEDHEPVVTSTGGSIEVAAGLPAVMGSETALRHVLHNLVRNALHHRRSDDPVHVFIDASVTGDRAVLSIADDGPGVPEADRSRVFDADVQVGRGSPGGSGLGLAAVRRLVEEMGGRVWIDEGDRGGTVVRVDLALADR